VEKATFAAGCFWGVEAAFRSIEGVLQTTVGYTGGHLANPSYKDVCTDRTGHAEGVEVVFDPGVVTYDDLLATFWRIHDPTQVNRQGPDFGSQYRSAIYYHSPEQEAAASAARAEAQSRFARPIATEITPASDFYPAEDYHQRYFERRGLASCAGSLQQQPAG
jgi:peptide-methionine (S)-S-oxide reductase